MSLSFILDHRSICFYASSGICSWSIILFLQLNIPILVILDVFRILLNTLVLLVSSSGLLSIHVLFFIFRAGWSLFHAKDGATDDSNNYKDEEYDNNEHKLGLHVDVWTKLMSYVHVVLLTIGFR